MSSRKRADQARVAVALWPQLRGRSVAPPPENSRHERRRRVILGDMERKRVVMMADLWGPLYALSDAGAIIDAIDPNTLGLNENLVEQLLAWSQGWVDVTGFNYGRIRDERTLAELRRTGARLATVLQRELGDTYEVLVVEVPVSGAPEAGAARPVT